MTTTERDRLLPPELTPEEIAMVQAAQRLVMEALDHSRAASITLESNNGDAPTVSVPPKVLQVLGRALGLMAQRQPILLIPQRQELSTVEAANYLNVSRPFVIKEIEAKRLPHRKVGTHRRVLYEDLVEYARKMRAEQEAALDRMADDASELGLNY